MAPPASTPSASSQKRKASQTPGSQSNPPKPQKMAKSKLSTKSKAQKVGSMLDVNSDDELGTPQPSAAGSRASSMAPVSVCYTLFLRLLLYELLLLLPVLLVGNPVFP
jgi:hypothetical protein